MSKSDNKLINDGFLSIDEAGDVKTSIDGFAGSTDEQKPILIIGPARSATSLIAGTLSQLGYYSGVGSAPPVFEDVYMRNAIKKYDWHRLREICSSYSKSHEQWLFKWTVPALAMSPSQRVMNSLMRKPTELNSLKKLYHSMNKPRVIITYKDIFAISNRNRISINSDIFDGIRGALAAYETIRRFQISENPCSLMISTEKALKNKHSLVDNLIDFSGAKVGALQKQAALDFIEPIPTRYLASTKYNSGLCIGNLDSFSTSEVNGWAKYKDNDNEANVVLFINDQKISTTKANGFRSDLKDAGHRDGRCAFKFNNIDASLLDTGASIRVRVEGDTQDLANSPMIIQCAHRDRVKAI